MEYRGVYLEIGGGWLPIVEPLIDFVIDNGGRVNQVKQKFSELRFYYDEPEDIEWEDFDKEVAEAERIAQQTCEMCGDLGFRTSYGYTVAILCERHTEELDYTPMETKYT